MENEMETLGPLRVYIGILPQEWRNKWSRTWKMKWKLGLYRGYLYLGLRDLRCRDLEFRVQGLGFRVLGC